MRLGRIVLVPKLSSMTQETLRWKFFRFCLIGKAKQWYTSAIGSTNGDWDELKDKFCLAFFPMSRIISLQRAILDFEQHEKESIGAAGLGSQRYYMPAHT